MVDLYGADKGNISLPPRLQSPEVLDGQTDNLKHVMILNMQKAFYNVRITDIAKRIQRLESRNAELEDSCAASKCSFLETDIETADKITQLNRQIFSEMEKITEYQKRVGTVQKWMNEEKQAHLDKVEVVNEKYAKTRLEITSEIKVLNAKINTLEEYKVSKSDLRNKLTARNNLIAQREEEAKQRCEQIQRKFKIGREKLKKEMYARLQGLAGTFQTEVAASVAKPIHRLMRENIFLKNELFDIARESIPKKEDIKQKIETDKKTGYETAMSKNRTVDHLIESKIQGYLLAAVKEQHHRAKDCYEKLQQSNSIRRMKLSENSYGISKHHAEKALQQIRVLESRLHKQQSQLGFVKYLNDKSKTEVQRCFDLFYDVKYAVACALKRTDTGRDISEMGERQLINYLHGILSKEKTQRWQNRTPSVATVPSVHEAYKTGDLGFEAYHTELRRSVAQSRPFNPSSLKLLEARGAKLSRTSSVKSQMKPWEMDIFNLSKEFGENLNVNKSDVSSTETNSSSSSQDEELLQKSVSALAIGEMQPKTESQTESEVKIETDTVVIVEAPKQVEVDNYETIMESNEEEETKISTVMEESGRTSLQENIHQE